MTRLLDFSINYLMASDTRLGAVYVALAIICLFVGWVDEVPS